MGKYFNPTTEEAVRNAGGRELYVYGKYQYLSLMREIKYGECLVGRFNKGFSHVMPLLNNEDEFEEFMNQYNAGYFLSYEFYAMPNSVFDINQTSNTASSAASSTIASAASSVVASGASSGASSAVDSAVASGASSTASSTASSAVTSTVASAVASAAPSATPSVVASTASPNKFVVRDEGLHCSFWSPYKK
jgi:hypothetical protein